MSFYYAYVCTECNFKDKDMDAFAPVWEREPVPYGDRTVDAGGYLLTCPNCGSEEVEERSFVGNSPN